MISQVYVQSDPYGGLNAPYLFKELESPLPSQIPFKHPGVSGPPEKRTLDAPLIQSSSSTDRKKANAQICYARVSRQVNKTTNKAGAPECAVFVSRSFSEYDGSGINRRSVVFGLTEVNEELKDKAKLVAATPLDEWRAVDVLREWTLDGVLLGRHKLVVQEDTLNVCVAGHCMARNLFDSENVFPMDTCFLCLIAEIMDAGLPTEHFGFSYVPCTSRSFSDTDIAGTHVARKRPTLSEAQITRVVGAWKLGRVVDNASVKERDQHSLTLSVAIEWVDWRALKEQFPLAGVADEWLRMPGAPRWNPCELFNWPSKVEKDEPLESPSIPPRNEDELRLDKHIKDEDAKRCAFVGPFVQAGGVPPMPPADTKRIKRTASDTDLFDKQPPLSPPQKRVVEEAGKDAIQLIEETNEDKSDWNNYLQTTIGLEVEMEPWTLRMKRKLVAYVIKYASVIHKIERGYVDDKDGRVTQVVDANRYMETFERNNPDIVPSVPAYIRF